MVFIQQSGIFDSPFVGMVEGAEGVDHDHADFLFAHFLEVVGG